MPHAKASLLTWTVVLWAACVHGAQSAEPTAATGSPPDAERRAAWRPAAGFVQVATGPSTRAFNAGLRWNTGRRWALGDRVQAELFAEACVGRWHSTPTDATQVTLAPSLRLQRRDARWYADVGVGPSWISPVFANGDRRFSTTFNFRSHLALGYRAGRDRRHELSIRIEHFSNGGIEEPNPGLNLAGVRYTRRF